MFNKVLNDRSLVQERQNSISITNHPNNIDNKELNNLKEKINSLYQKLLIFNERFYQEHLILLDRLYSFKNLINQYFKDIKEFHSNGNISNFYNLQYSIDKAINIKNNRISEKAIGKLPTKEYFDHIKILCINEFKDDFINLNNIIYNLFPNIKINIDNYLNKGFIWFKFNNITYDIPYLAFLITLSLLNYINDIKKALPILS